MKKRLKKKQSRDLRKNSTREYRFTFDKNIPTSVDIVVVIPAEKLLGGRKSTADISSHGPYLVFDTKKGIFVPSAWPATSSGMETWMNTLANLSGKTRKFLSGSQRKKRNQSAGNQKNSKKKYRIIRKN